MRIESGGGWSHRHHCMHVPMATTGLTHFSRQVPRGLKRVGKGALNCVRNMAAVGIAVGGFAFNRRGVAAALESALESHRRRRGVTAVGGVACAGGVE